MNLIEASGGLAFGRPGGPELDIVPISAVAREDPLGSLMRALLADALMWGRPQLPTTHLHGRNRQVVMGGDRETGISVRLMWPSGMSAAQALADIEDCEPELPGALTMALVAAARGLERGIKDSRVGLAAFTAAQIGHLIGLSPSRPLPPPMARREIEAMVQRLQPGQLDFSVPTRPSDVARYVAELGRRLWAPEWLATAEQLAADGTLDYAAMAASCELMLRADVTIEVAGVPLRVEGRAVMLVGWLQAADLQGVDAPTLNILLPDRRLQSIADADMYVDDGTPDEGEDAALLQGMAASLVQEAEERAAYVPMGAFRLRMPAELGLVRGVADSLMVVADPAGLWVRAQGTEGDRLWRWEPAEGVRSCATPKRLRLLMHAVLAALWHDLRVAGEQAVPEERPRRPRSAPAREPGEQPSRRQGPAVRTLPALRLAGRREWGTAAERQHIVRRAHGVRGHLRRLLEGWERTEQAARAAGDYGIVLPAGHTFVRPHIRGQGDEDIEAAVAPVEVRARGLATLIGLLRR
jgi:hypothetical protein